MLRCGNFRVDRLISDIREKFKLFARGQVRESIKRQAVMSLETFDGEYECEEMALV